MLKTAVSVVVMALSVTASGTTYAPAGEIHIGVGRSPDVAGGRAQGIPDSLRVLVYAPSK